MVTPQERENKLLELLADSRTTNELAVAALTIVLLEHIVNFADEVNMIWKSRFSISSAAYIWIRYFTLVVLCIDVSFMLGVEWSDHMCRSFLFGEMGTCTIIAISADLILIWRVWILYGGSTRFIYFMVPLIAAEIIAMLAVGVYTVTLLKQYVHVGPILEGCHSLQVPPRLFTFYSVPPFITAVLMFLMTTYKCGSTVMSLGLRRTPIISLFLRDGLFWFLALLLVYTVQIALWAKGRPTLAQIPIVPSTAMNAVIVARVVLNIKHVASIPPSTTTVGSELVFKPPGATHALGDSGTNFALNSQFGDV